MSLRIELVVDEPGWETVPDLSGLIERCIGNAQAISGVALAEGAEMSILLCDDATIQDLNGRWRGHDKPTNVLSFPAAPPASLAEPPLVGDIAVAFETTRREAEQDGKPLADHLAHLVVHGFLHLVGHDHETTTDAEEMEALETRILAALRIADPYAGTELLPQGSQ